MLRDPAQDAREPGDAPIDPRKRGEGLGVSRTELVRGHVVFHEVHVERGHPCVQVGGHAEREELAEPAADQKLRDEPPERSHTTPQGEVAERPTEPREEAAERHDRHLGDQPEQDRERHVGVPAALQQQPAAGAHAHEGEEDLHGTGAPDKRRRCRCSTEKPPEQYPVRGRVTTPPHHVSLSSVVGR